MSEPWTPGPWADAGDHGGSRMIYGPDGYDDAVVWEVAGGGREDANAVLISLAPSMAELLDTLIREDSITDGYLVEKIEGLLKRARGEV